VLAAPAAQLFVCCDAHAIQAQIFALAAPAACLLLGAMLV